MGLLIAIATICAGGIVFLLRFLLAIQQEIRESKNGRPYRREKSFWGEYLEVPEPLYVRGQPALSGVSVERQRITVGPHEIRVLDDVSSLQADERNGQCLSRR